MPKKSDKSDDLKIWTICRKLEIRKNRRIYIIYVINTCPGINHYKKIRIGQSLRSVLKKLKKVIYS